MTFSTLPIATMTRLDSGKRGGVDLVAMSKELARFRTPDDRRGILELAVTAVPLLLLWYLMWLSLDLHYLVSLFLAVPAAGFLLRLFLIQHDCGHGAFFSRRRANDWAGRCIGVLTLSPYDFWRRTHGMHHAGTGNLDRRGIGDVDTLTVREFNALGWRGRTRYRLYRHPVILFGLGPAYLFFLRYRLPLGLMRHGWRPWISTMTTNLAIAGLCAALMLLVGVGPFLLVQVPITLIAASLGVWLFYVQHQFENTLWRRTEDWDFREAAVHGSSHYALPIVLRWFSANIGVHHIHHLCSGIPFYRLPAALRSQPALCDINRLTLGKSIRSIGLVLWDEERGRLISFREARAPSSAGALASLFRRVTGMGPTLQF